MSVRFRKHLLPLRILLGKSTGGMAAVSMLCDLRMVADHKIVVLKREAGKAFLRPTFFDCV